jgi:hypothetical protein
MFSFFFMMSSIFSLKNTDSIDKVFFQRRFILNILDMIVLSKFLPLGLHKEDWVEYLYNHPFFLNPFCNEL